VAKSIKRVLSRDTWKGRKYYDYVVTYNNQRKIFFGYRRQEAIVKKEAQAFYDSLPGRLKKIKPPKYKRGDLVYSYQNPTVKRPVSHVFPSDDPEYSHKYKLALQDKDGYSYSSKYLNEESLSRRKKS